MAPSSRRPLHNELHLLFFSSRIYKGFNPVSHRLYGNLNGTTPAPHEWIMQEVKNAIGQIQETVAEINPEYETWMAHDQSLVAYITSTMSEEVLEDVDDDLSALELWNVLATTYSQVLEARFLQLKRQFQDIKRGTRSVLEYIHEIKNVSDQLAIIGHPVSDKDKVQQALSGLGSDFDVFCIALEVLPVLPSFEDLKAKLIQHETSHIQQQKLFPSGSHNVLITGTHALQRSRPRVWNSQAGMGRAHVTGYVTWVRLQRRRTLPVPVRYRYRYAIGYTSGTALTVPGMVNVPEAYPTFFGHGQS
ncbi:hypothetical protein EJ110_NYTH60120 [Nymphaea thermarum]|nr:hypothetical protein EJ110_NYTH60120 [Nymphaea thermarum]